MVRVTVVGFGGLVYEYGCNAGLVMQTLSAASATNWFVYVKDIKPDNVLLKFQPRDLYQVLNRNDPHHLLPTLHP